MTEVGSVELSVRLSQDALRADIERAKQSIALIKDQTAKVSIEADAKNLERLKSQIASIDKNTAIDLKINVDRSADLAKIRAQVDDLRRENVNIRIDVDSQKAEAGIGKINSLVAGIGAGVGIAAFDALVQGAQAAAGAIATSTLEFEKFRTVLTTTLGTELAAEGALSQLQEFAASTPFQLNEVVAAYIKLKNQGLDPTSEALTRLGDIASSQGKSLDQITEAILDAANGENERLKEFGINAQAAGDKVKFTFKGVTQEVEKTPEAISGAILKFGELQGVAGGMEAQSKTLGGQLSNLQDNATKAAVAFGSELAPVLTEIVGAINQNADGFVSFAGSVGQVASEVVGTVLDVAGSIGEVASAIGEIGDNNPEFAEIASIVGDTLVNGFQVAVGVIESAVNAVGLLAAGFDAFTKTDVFQVYISGVVEQLQNLANGVETVNNILAESGFGKSSGDRVSDKADKILEKAQKRAADRAKQPEIDQRQETLKTNRQAELQKERDEKAAKEAEKSAKKRQQQQAKAQRDQAKAERESAKKLEDERKSALEASDRNLKQQREKVDAGEADSLLNAKSSQAKGRIVGEGGQTEALKIQQQATAQRVSLAQSELAEIDRLRKAGTLSEKEAFDRSLSARQQLRQEKAKQVDLELQLELKAIQKTVDAQKRATDAAVSGIARQKAALDAQNQALDRAAKLNDARANRDSARSDLTQSQLQGQASRASEGLDALTRLQSGDVGANEAAVLRDQASALTGVSVGAGQVPDQQQLLQALQQRQAIEAAIDKEKLAALSRQEAAERVSLDLKLKQQEISAKNNLLEAQRAELLAKQNINEAQGNLLKVQKTGDRNEIANAESALKIARDGAAIANEQTKSAQEGLALQKELQGIEKETQALRQAKTRGEAVGAADQGDRKRQLEQARFIDDQAKKQADAQNERNSQQAQFNEDQRSREKAAFDARISEQKKGVDRQLQLEFAKPGERKKLEKQFQKEDQMAARRAQLEAPIVAQQQAFEQSQKAATVAPSAASAIALPANQIVPTGGLPSAATGVSPASATGLTVTPATGVQATPTPGSPLDGVKAQPPQGADIVQFLGTKFDELKAAFMEFASAVASTPSIGSLSVSAPDPVGQIGQITGELSKQRSNGANL